MAGTIVVDRIESDASYASSINVASQITFSNTVTTANITTANITTATVTTANITTANVTGVSTFAAGSNTAPSLTTSGDTNTGLYFPAADTIAFTEGGVEAGRFNSSGNLQIYNLGLGATTPSTSGTGITFPATQSASSDANTLDDYEEGTWTPSITFGGTSTGITYSFQTGRYTKVGNQVTIFMYIQISSKGSATGNLDIGGLPFASANINSFYTGGAMRIGSTTGMSGAAQFYCSPNSTSLAMEIVSNTRITNTNIGTTSDFSLNWSYMV